QMKRLQSSIDSGEQTPARISRHVTAVSRDGPFICLVSGGDPLIVDAPVDGPDMLFFSGRPQCDIEFLHKRYGEVFLDVELRAVDMTRRDELSNLMASK